MIFRKVRLGTRSAAGSETIATFAGIVETARLRGCSTLEILEALPTAPPEKAHDIVFPKAAGQGARDG